MIEAHRFQPVFLTKNENLFSSYIITNDVPGPGHYQKNHKKRRKQPKKIFEYINY